MCLKVPTNSLRDFAFFRPAGSRLPLASHSQYKRRAATSKPPTAWRTERTWAACRRRCGLYCEHASAAGLGTPCRAGFEAGLLCSATQITTVHSVYCFYTGNIAKLHPLSVVGVGRLSRAVPPDGGFPRMHQAAGAAQHRVGPTA